MVTVYLAEDRYAVIDDGRIEGKRVAYAVERPAGLLEASDIGAEETHAVVAHGLRAAGDAPHYG